VRCVHDVYWVGVLSGLGSAAGLLCGAALAGVRYGLTVAALVAALAGGFLGLAIDGWAEALGGVVGAGAGVLAAGQIVPGALRRGGTRGGTLTLVGGGALVVAALAFIPLVGYLEAVGLPVLGARLRSREPKRYAGLRILDR
jgi:hypothetical protein